MKKIKLFYLSLFFYTACFTQNIVPNPSFEDTLNCPNYVAQINKAIGWKTFGGTPDYFNSCSNGMCGVPHNAFGYQFARTGNGCAGLYTFASVQTPIISAWESIGIQLNQTMVVGQEYYVSFYASRAAAYLNTGMSTNNLGAKFSTVPYSAPFTLSMPINNFAHIYAEFVITDSTNWVQVSGTFIADSAYQYIGIGNFFDFPHTTIIPELNGSNTAYYYIDDVLVEESNPTNISSSDKKSLCQIFPNPFNNEIKISNPEFENNPHFRIYNALGVLVLERKLNAANQNVDLSALSSGTYRVTISNKIGQVLQNKNLIKID